MSLGELIEGENPDFDKTYSLTEASFFNRLSKEKFRRAYQECDLDERCYQGKSTP